MGCMYQLHPFHLVKSSPWPLSLSMSLLFLAFSFLGSLQSLPFFMTCLSCLYSFSVICLWQLDIIIESTYEGSHTLRVRSGLTIGWLVFLCSEVMFFFRFSGHSSISRSRPTLPLVGLGRLVVSLA